MSFSNAAQTLANMVISIGCLFTVVLTTDEFLQVLTSPFHIVVGLAVLWTAAMIYSLIFALLKMVFDYTTYITLMLYILALVYHSVVHAAYTLIAKRSLWIVGSCITAVLAYRYAVGWLNKTIRFYKLEVQRKECECPHQYCTKRRDATRC